MCFDSNFLECFVTEADRAKKNEAKQAAEIAKVR